MKTVGFAEENLNWGGFATSSKGHDQVETHLVVSARCQEAREDPVTFPTQQKDSEAKASG